MLGFLWILRHGNWKAACLVIPSPCLMLQAYKTCTVRAGCTGTWRQDELCSIMDDLLEFHPFWVHDWNTQCRVTKQTQQVYGLSRLTSNNIKGSPLSLWQSGTGFLSSCVFSASSIRTATRYWRILPQGWEYWPFVWALRVGSDPQWPKNAKTVCQWLV